MSRLSFGNGEGPASINPVASWARLIGILVRVPDHAFQDRLISLFAYVFFLYFVVWVVFPLLQPIVKVARPENLWVI